MNNIIEKIKKQINYENITKLVLIFILLQPLFDILSFLSIRNIIPIKISTYLKPFFVFGIAFLIYIADKRQRKKWTILYIAFIVLIIGHMLLMLNIEVELSIILHEMRFLFNIAYMLVLYMIFDYLYNKNEDKKKFIKKLRKTLILTLYIYCITIIVAILTGTSAKTYEYSDALKKGYKGWLDSGQIFGHALSMCLPIVLFYALNNTMDNKVKKYLTKALIILPSIVLSLIGTKATLYILIANIIVYIILEIYFIIKDKKDHKESLTNCLIVFIIFIAIILLFPKLPAIMNQKLQNEVDENQLLVDNKEKDLWCKGYIDEINKENKENNENNENNEKKRYEEYHLHAINKINEKFKNGSLVFSENRKKQFIYNYNKFLVSDIKYKIFGLGYLNQPLDLTIERDILMALFGFGIMGFVVMLGTPIIIWLKSIFNILKNIRNIKFSTLMLFLSLSIFFCISFIAGYTFIYTNFSIFLVIVIQILKARIDNKYE